MKKTTATCTWVLAILIAAGTLLATTQTSYADRSRDQGRQDQRSWNDRDRDQRSDRNIDRGRDRTRDRYDRNRSFRRPPIMAMRGFGTRVLIIRGPVVIMTWGGSPYSYGGWR